MKKWVNVNWDEIQHGDVLKSHYLGDIFRGIVEHIGDRYLKAKGSSVLIGRYIYKGSQQAAVMFQRYEETELPDDWYLVELKPGVRTVRYKTGNKIYDGPDKKYPNWSVSDYKILKRARFEDLEE